VSLKDEHWVRRPWTLQS